MKKSPQPKNLAASVSRIGSKSPASTSIAGVPTLFITDVHYGTAVHPDAVMGQNSYNRVIAKLRIERTVNWFIDWALREANGKPFEGCVLALGGDMAESGAIEAVRGGTAVSAINELAHILYKQIKRLEEVFGEVVVFGVAGNHGQGGKRVPASLAAEHNSDTEVYAELERLAENDELVQIIYSRHAFEQVWYLYDTPYLLVHGDMLQPKSMAKNHIVAEAQSYRDKKVRQLYGVVPGIENVIMLFGHFHTAIEAKDLGFIAGGSLKGWDDWARRVALVQETPRSQAWITHAKAGISSRVEIFAYEPRAAEDSNPGELPAIRPVSAKYAEEAFDCDARLSALS